jgi:hypothetical protein
MMNMTTRSPLSVREEEKGTTGSWGRGIHGMEEKWEWAVQVGPAHAEGEAHAPTRPGGRWWPEREEKRREKWAAVAG